MLGLFFAVADAKYSNKAPEASSCNMVGMLKIFVEYMVGWTVNLF